MNPLGLTEAHLIDRDGVHKRARLPLSGYGHTNDNTPHPFPNCAVKLIRPDKSTVVGDHTGTSGAVTFFFVFVPSSLFQALCSKLVKAAILALVLALLHVSQLFDNSNLETE